MTPPTPPASDVESSWRGRQRLRAESPPRGSWPTRRARVPDELRFRVHVPHPVLCKPLVQTVERGSQEAPDDPHHDEETQIHSCPEVTFFIGVSALREGVRERETKNHSAHENRKGQSGEETREAPPLRESQCRAERAAGAGDQRGSDTPPKLYLRFRSLPSGASLESDCHGSRKKFWGEGQNIP